MILLISSTWRIILHQNLFALFERWSLRYEVKIKGGEVTRGIDIRTKGRGHGSKLVLSGSMQNKYVSC